MSYGVENIKTLSFPVSCQKRLSMYFGSQARNENTPAQKNTGIREIVDNSVGEALNGYANKITITFQKDGFIEVLDNGRGVPYGIDKETGKNGIIKCLATLHSGGGFDAPVGKATPSLNGVGAATTNAVSARFDVEVYRNNRKHCLSFRNGIAGKFDKNDPSEKAKFKETEKLWSEAYKHERGTLIRFKFNDKFFSPVDNIIVDDIIERLRYTVYLVPDLEVTVVDKTRKKADGGGEYKFKNVGGIKGMLDFISTGNAIITGTKDEYAKKGIFGVETKGKYVEQYLDVKDKTRPEIKERNAVVPIEVALRFNKDDKSDIRSFANTIGTYQGGVHEIALKNAIVDTFGKQATKFNKTKIKITEDDVLANVNAVISINVNEPKFSSQAKVKLSGRDVEIAIKNALTREFNKFIKDELTEKQAQTVYGRIVDNAKIRAAADVAKATKKKSLITKSPTNLPSKLKDCKRVGDENSELFICLKGDTKIKLLNGTIKEIAELEKEYYGKEFWLYSVNEHGEFVPAKAKNVRITQRVNHMKRITLSDGTTIECTPEHRFMKRDNMKWIEAKDLKNDDSLFHLSFAEKDGYEVVYNVAKRQYEKTHVIVNSLIDYNKSYRENNIDNYLITHHIDENRFNNCPDNLIFMDRDEHFKDTEHVSRKNAIEALKAYSQTEEHKQKSSERLITYNKSERHKIDMQRAWANPEKRKKMSQGVQNEYGRKKISNAVSQAHADGRYDKMPYYNQANKIGWTINKMIEQKLDLTEENFNRTRKHSNYPKYEKILNYFNTYEEAIEYGRNYNYRIINIEDVYYEKAIPVYCLTVQNEFHSYALANGLITHNCEGDSAAGSILAARDAEYQAVLPVRGKVLNIMKLDFSNKNQFAKFNNNAEINDLIRALGAGVGDKFDIDRTRYGSVYIACDSDVDGNQIACLLLGIFYKIFRPMIEEGRVYQIVSPLYEIKYKYKGKEQMAYAVDEQERINILKEFKQKRISKYEILHAKGLGEINSSTFSAVLDPLKRKVKRITMGDAEAAYEMIHLAIGNRSADDRKEWMISHSEIIEELGLYE